MPKPIPQREVVRRCLRRIQCWQKVPPFAAQERDWTFFASAFHEYPMASHHIMRALATLEAAGFIALTFPRPESEPDVFVIAYLDTQTAQPQALKGPHAPTPCPDRLLNHQP